MTNPTVTTGQVHDLMTRLAEFVQTTTPAAQAARRRPVAEVDGLPFLPGPKRALSASCRALLETPPTCDLSAVLWRVLCGAAAARWRYADVAALADAPGLEHVRTLRSGATRMPRPRRGPASPVAVLRRQWTRAVHAVAALAPGHDGTDVTFESRAEIVTGIVRTVQPEPSTIPGEPRNAFQALSPVSRRRAAHAALALTVTGQSSSCAVRRRIRRHGPWGSE